MGIYQRDNINYGGLLGNAMANRMAYAQRDADIQRQMGQNWGNALNQGAQGIAAGLNTWNQQRIDQNKLTQQQQFQAEQKALDRALEIKRAQEQQAWQAAQNELQRESNEYIAGLNRKTSTEERAAQNVMNYQNALSAQQYAEQALSNAKPGTMEWAMAQRDLQYAKNKVDYYGSQIDPKLHLPTLPAGTKEDPIVVSGPEAEAALMNEKFTTEEPETEWERKERINRFETLEKTPKSQYTNAIKAKLLEEAKGDEALITRINNLGKTVEERRASDAAELKKLDAEFQKMSPMEQDIWLDNHPGYGVLNGHLARKKR